MRIDKLFILLLFFRILLDVYYNFALVFVVNNHAEYVFDFSLDTYVLSWIVFLLISGLYRLFILDVDRLSQSFSQQFFVLLFILSVVPVTAMFGGGGMSVECFGCYSILVIWLLTLQAFAYGFIQTSKYKEVVKNYKWKKIMFWFIGIISLLAIVITFFGYINGKFFFGGLYVYEQRALFSQIVKDMPRILVYLIGMANVVEIYLLLYCLYWKKYKFVPLLLIIWYMHFSLGGDKIVLFSELLALATYILAKRVSLIKIFITGCCVVALCSIEVCLQYFNRIDIAWGATLLRRVFFVPARLQDHWFDFFCSHAQNLWGINTEYAIGQGLENIISDIYLNAPLGHADTGLLGDCFANLGIYGIILYPIVLVAILAAFDYAVRGKDCRLFCGVSILFVMHIMDSMLTTVMVSHGGFLMLFMLWLFPTKDNDYDV